MGILLVFSLYAKDLRSIFFSELFCSSFSSSNTVLDDFLIKIRFPSMEIHTYGSAYNLSLTQK